MLYFSFTTLTTLGYGDITPTSYTAKMWAMTEAMMGGYVSCSNDKSISLTF